VNLPNLQTLDCSNNNLTRLPDNMNFPNLRDFDCGDNNLTSLPENMNFPNLKSFHCYHNNLTSLPENMNFPNLQKFYCNHNNLRTLPLCIMNIRGLRKICYSNNAIDDLPIQLFRFINRLNNNNINRLNIYNDGQNIHESNIQLSVRESINRLSTRTDIDKYNKDELIKEILEDDVINCKEQIIEYINDNSIHSLLLLSFGEVLWYVMRTIKIDFNMETQKEIKKVLNEDMSDALCKCFTGRISRVINCLSGFSDLVDIKIKDESQIGNIIVLVKERLGQEYSVEEHKRLVIKELREREFDNDVIEEWVSYIE